MSAITYTRKELLQHSIPINVTKKIGSGSFGIVFSGFDYITKTQCAVKKIYKSYLPREQRLLCTELVILRKHCHPSLLHCSAVYLNKSKNTVYIVTDLYQGNLQNIIYSGQKLSLSHRQYFTYQIILGVEYLHRHHIIHRDIKPGNILINSDCKVVICDFGMAKKMSNSNEDQLLSPTLNTRDMDDLMSTYVVTRWYRAPEIMREGLYNKAIDMWSVGCVIYELLFKHAMFQGSSEECQLKLIDEFDKDKDSKFSQLEDIFISNEDPNFDCHRSKILVERQFIEKLLVIDPTKRLSACDAMKHEYLHNIELPDLHETHSQYLMYYKEPTTKEECNIIFELMNSSTLVDESPLELC